MKKWIILFLCILLTISFTACGQSEKEADTATTTATDPVESTTEPSQCQHTYNEYIQREASYGIEGWKVLSCPLCGYVQHEAIEALPSILEVTVTDKTTAIRDTAPYDGSDAAKECCVFFDIDLKNTSDKIIKEIKGTLTILCGTSILELSCSFEDLSIEGYTTTSIESYGYTFSYISMPNTPERRVFDAEWEDMKFTFQLTSIVVEE